MRLRLLLVRLGLLLLIGAGGFLGYRSYQEHQRNAKIQGEIDKLQAEADKIRRENETLAQRIAYLASPDFQEQEAKQKLGMKRQEEEVVAVRERPWLTDAISSNDPIDLERQSLESSTPNYQKWWRLFFGQPE